MWMHQIHSYRHDSWVFSRDGPKILFKRGTTVYGYSSIHQSPKSFPFLRNRTHKGDFFSSPQVSIVGFKMLLIVKGHSPEVLVQRVSFLWLWAPYLLPLWPLRAWNFILIQFLSSGNFRPFLELNAFILTLASVGQCLYIWVWWVHCYLWRP